MNSKEIPMGLETLKLIESWLGHAIEAIEPQAHAKMIADRWEDPEEKITAEIDAISCIAFTDCLKLIRATKKVITEHTKDNLPEKPEPKLKLIEL